jgi:predicted nucleic acid-binding protein
MAAEVQMVVLDTSVVSIFLRDVASAGFYRNKIDGLRAVVSFQTREEALFGAIKSGWGARKMNALRRHLDQYDMVGATPELVDICANLRSERESVGRKLNTADAWIAATALLLDCPLASHDGDFDDIPSLELIREYPGLT